MPETPQPGQLREELEQEVLDPIAVSHPNTGENLDYYAYLELDPELRSGDERPFVDDAFTRRLLAWLGYEEADRDYDRREEGTGDRPDWKVAPTQATAFVVEDKNSTQVFFQLIKKCICWVSV